jgi:hypothetical protein
MEYVTTEFINELNVITSEFKKLEETNRKKEKEFIQNSEYNACKKINRFTNMVRFYDKDIIDAHKKDFAHVEVLRKQLDEYKSKGVDSKLVAECEVVINSYLEPINALKEKQNARIKQYSHEMWISHAESVRAYKAELTNEVEKLRKQRVAELYKKYS